MKLNFYYTLDGSVPDPLIASATFAGSGNEQPPWLEGNLEFFDFDLTPFLQAEPAWEQQDQIFRQTLREELKKHIIVRLSPSAKAWTHRAFENVVKFGLPKFRHFTRARLWEDDGSECTVP